MSTMEIVFAANGLICAVLGVVKSASKKPLGPNEASSPQYMQMAILWFIATLLCP